MAETFRSDPVDQENGTVVHVKVLNDGYAAALYVPEDAGSFPTLKQIHLAIEKAKVSYGINDKAIDKLVKEQVRGKALIFAKGDEPSDGGHARLIWNDISEDGASPQDITDLIGSGRHLQIFTKVGKGDQILSKLPPTEGSAGMNIFGKSVIVTGNDIAMPNGEGTVLSNDGLTLMAARAGIAHWDGVGVAVTEMQHIAGSVDSTTGDIMADTAVYIEQDVHSGMRVEAMGDIFIGGNIEGADVYSRSGSVWVRNGIIGHSKARILAGSNIVAGFIQDATIGAKENVEVDRYIINSAVTAGRYLLVISNEGLIRGGTAFAEKKIHVRVAGSENRTATELKVGFTPPHAQTKEKYQLRTDQRRNRMELAYIQKRLSFLKILKQRMGTLTPDKEIQYNELERKETVLLHEHKRHAQLEAELEQHEREKPDEETESESIRIQDTIYPEVALGIGDTNMLMKKERHNLLIYRAGDILSYGPLEQALRKKA